MKKLIILILCLCSLTSIAQLKGTLTECVQCDIQGGKLDYAVYKSNVKTDHWVVFLPGTGEMGDGAGGKLPLIYRYGYPKLVKSGIDLPFNMLMIQPVAYDGWKKNQLGWFNLKFKPSKTILIGISLGAICALDQMTNDPFNIIDGVVSLSGKPSGGSDAVSRMISIPGYCFYGQKDTQVSYTTGIRFFNAYNTAHAGTTDVFYMDLQPILGHCCWDTVMTMDGTLMSWLNIQFGPEEPDNQYDKGLLDGLNQAKSTLDSLINVTLNK